MTTLICKQVRHQQAFARGLYLSSTATLHISKDVQLWQLRSMELPSGGILGLVRYLAERRTAQDKELKDRQEERERRAQERFQAAVTGLADDKEGAKIGATIVLRNFLKPGYEEFYIQIFDLTVANLRNPRTSILPEDPDPPLSPLNRALAVIFREAFPLARRQFKESPQSVLAMEERFQDQDVTGIPALDAAGIQLDSAYLREVDLKEAWMPR
jgi:hypothetical protein